MPNHQQTPRRSSKAQIWAKRSVHLKSYLQDLPRRLRLDVEALVRSSSLDGHYYSNLLIII